MRLTRSAFWELLTRIFCAVAVLSISFSLPENSNARQISPAEIAAYVLPDGTLPPLCVTLPDGSGQGKIVKLGADTLGLHHPSILSFPHFAATPVALSGSGERILAQSLILRHLIYPPGSGPRAPPAYC